jgi:hypothetical protein
MANMVLNVTVEPRYDTNFIPTAGTNQVLFFANPIGTGTSNWATASSKTIADTNMDLQGQLPSGQNFTVLGFRLLPSFNMTVADSTLAFNGAAFIFLLSAVEMLRVPARTIPAGMGPVSATTTVASHGWQELGNGFKIGRQSLNLAQNQNFSAKLVWPGGGQAVTTTMAGGTTVGVAGLPITILLDGFLQRLPQ